MLIFLKFRGNTVKYLRSKGVRIGEHCTIQSKAFGSEPWLIQIGDRVTIGAGTVFITHDGASRLFREKVNNEDKYTNRYGTILIEENCFIGWNSIILHGVKIGRNSIVGSGSVVNNDIPSNEVHAGVPARKICTLKEYINKFDKEKIEIRAQSRKELRDELTIKLWGEKR